MLWRVEVQRDTDPPEQWIALVLANTERGARRAATIAVGPEYHSTIVEMIDPYKTGVLITLRKEDVQYVRREHSQW